MYWYLSQNHTQNIWSDSASEPGQVDWVELDSDNWTKIRFVQALYSNSAIDESPSKVEQTSSSPEIQEDIPTPGDPLPPISEEDSTDSYFKMDGELDEDMMKALKEANHLSLIHI